MRWIIQSVGLSLIMILMVGTCFGYAILQPVLIKENLFMDRCNFSNNLVNQSNSTVEECQINIMAFAASVSFSVIYCACFPMGVFTDLVGSRVALYVGCICWVIFTSIMGVLPSQGNFIFFFFLRSFHYFSKLNFKVGFFTLDLPLVQL